MVRGPMVGNAAPGEGEDGGSGPEDNNKVSAGRNVRMTRDMQKDNAQPVHMRQLVEYVMGRCLEFEEEKDH